MAHQNRERKISLLICVLVLFSVALGCRQLGRRTSNRSMNIRNSNSNNGKPSDGLTEKSNLYIKQCINKYSNTVIGSYRRYASWLRDLDKGPTGKEDLVYGL